jgi:foldase protein PrsA
MRYRSVLVILVLTMLLLSVVACQAKTETASTPEADSTLPTATVVTSTPIAAAPEQQTIPATAATLDSATPTPAPSLAEQSRARKPAIIAALGTMALPESGIVAASVNGVEITVDQLKEFMQLRMEGLASQYGIDWAQEDSATLVTQVESEVLEQLIEMKLISQGAAKAGVIADAAELSGLEHEVQQSILENQGYETWEDYLDAMGLSQAAFEEIMTQSLIVNQLILRQVTPTQAEQVHARHILVTDPDLAADLVQRLAAGEDFATLATANSEDTGSAQGGGDLGWFPRGIMVSEFEEAAFGLGIGEPSGVITTTYGYHIIDVLEKGTRDLTEDHRQQLQQSEFIKWLDAERAGSDIQRFVLQAVG